MSHRSKYQQLPTEAINPATLGIDKASSADIIELMLNDDRKVLAAVQREKPRIAIGVDIIVEALRKGGRVIFVGAGTSGRLGVVESAEMPTTFGTNPDSIQAVMAGGRTRSSTPRRAPRTATKTARARSSGSSRRRKTSSSACRPAA